MEGSGAPDIFLPPCGRRPCAEAAQGLLPQSLMALAGGNSDIDDRDVVLHLAQYDESSPLLFLHQPESDVVWC